MTPEPRRLRYVIAADIAGVPTWQVEDLQATGIVLLVSGP